YAGLGFGNPVDLEVWTGRGGFGSPNSSSSDEESASSSDEDESAAGSTKDGSGISSPSIEMVGLLAAGDVPACGGEA
ncbi:hypothetical protein B8W95_13690, partial [Staphylococcus pasteuri]